MNQYSKYPEYKDSEMEWLPVIPKHWQSIKVKRIFNERVNKGFPTEPLLAATQTKGVVRKEEYETNTVTAQKDFHLLKLVKVGDFVISLRSFQGGIEIAHQQGIISPAYTVMIPSADADKEFFKYLFKSKYFIDGLTTFVTGIREGQNIDYSKFRRSLIPLPHKLEQTSIAQFLNYNTVNIKTFIELKEKTIALLKERKTAIINQAVTKGLNPNVEMKKSGIEWLGEIPKHWEVKKLKHFVSKVGSGVTPSGGASVYVDKGIPLLRSQNVHFGRLDLSDVAFITDEVHHKMRGSRVMKGDILLNITGGSIGRCHYVEEGLGEANVNQHVCICRPTKQIESKYLNLLLASDIGQRQVWANQYGGGREGLNFPSIKGFTFAIPPKNERINIIEELEVKTLEFDSLISQAEKEIALIKEYQQSLISEAVTGKIDLREWEKSEVSYLVIDAKESLSVAAESETTYNKQI